MKKTLNVLLGAALVAALPLAAQANAPAAERASAGAAKAAKGGAATAEKPVKKEEKVDTERKTKTVKLVVVGDGEGKGDGEAHAFQVVVPDVRVDVPDFDVAAAPGGPPVWVSAVAGGGYLGVELTELTPELRAHFGAGEDAGVLVGRVEEDSPAQRAGVRVGDVLTHVDGQEVGSSLDVLRQIRPRKDGEVVGLEVVRDGRVENLTATLAERERPQIEANALLRRLGEGTEAVYEVDPAELSKRMARVGEYFSSPEWKAKMEEMEKNTANLQERLEMLQKQLDDLSTQLDERGSGGH